MKPQDFRQKPALAPITGTTVALILPKLTPCSVCKTLPDVTLTHNTVKIHCERGHKSMEVVYTPQEMLTLETDRLPKLMRMIDTWSKS